VFSVLPACVVAVLIDRLCSRHDINSPPYQFASLGAAMAGEVTVILVLNALFPRPVRWPIALTDTAAEAIGWTLAAMSGLAGSLGVYLFLRSRLLADSDYDDQSATPS
jgi:hypothetical protein